MKSILGICGVLALVACGGSGSGAEGESSDVVSQQPTSTRTVGLTDDPDVVALGNVWNVRDLVRQHSGEDTTYVRLVETGGGDPAINGNILYLIVETDPVYDANGEIQAEGTLNGYGPIANVRTIERAERLEADLVSLTLNIDSFDEAGELVQENLILDIELQEGRLAVLGPEGDPEIVSPFTGEDPVEEAVLSTMRVETKTFEDGAGGEIIARVYSVGTSGMEGVGLIKLNLMQYPTDYSFDLDIVGKLGRVVEYPDQGLIELEVTTETESGSETKYHVVEIIKDGAELQPSIKVTENDAAG